MRFPEAKTMLVDGDNLEKFFMTSSITAVRDNLARLFVALDYQGIYRI